MSFARDAAALAYYDRRADEYDEWYQGAGRFADRERPGWNEELEQVVALLADLQPRRTLDVACGTGFLTRHLRGFVVGVDQSPAMVAHAQRQLPDGLALVADALALPFAAGAFERVVTAHFYGHLRGEERLTFVEQARRLAGELVVVDSALRPGIEPEGWQERVLNDGSRHRVFKRYLSPGQLTAEFGAEVLHAGRWFVVARAPLEESGGASRT